MDGGSLFTPVVKHTNRHYMENHAKWYGRWSIELTDSHSIHLDVHTNATIFVISELAESRTNRWRSVILNAV